MRDRMIKSIASTCIGALALAGCGVDPAPAVAIVEVEPASLDPADDAADDLRIVVEYFDADADLGGGVAEVHDCRADGVVTALDIPAIASDEAIAARVPIEGRLALVVPDIGEVAAAAEAPAVCADLGVGAPAAGEAVFCVRLTDSAGNTGDGDCTEPIEVVAAAAP